MTGTAVPGLGNVGPEAAKPMQEGMAVLFKRLADIDVFDLEISTTDPDRFVEIVRSLEPTFGGINLKDIRAPEGLYIFRPAQREPEHPGLLSIVSRGHKNQRAAFGERSI